MYLKFAPNAKKIRRWETPVNFEKASSETKVGYFLAENLAHIPE